MEETGEDAIGLTRQRHGYGGGAEEVCIVRGREEERIRAGQEPRMEEATRIWWFLHSSGEMQRTAYRDLVNVL